MKSMTIKLCDRFGVTMPLIKNKHDQDVKIKFLPFKCPLDDSHDKYIPKRLR